MSLGFFVCLFCGLHSAQGNLKGNRAKEAHLHLKGVGENICCRRFKPIWNLPHILEAYLSFYETFQDLEPQICMRRTKDYLDSASYFRGLFLLLCNSITFPILNRYVHIRRRII